MTSHRMAIAADFETKLDADLARMACFSGAQDERYAPLLPEKFVLASNYLKSFPQHCFSLSNTIREDEKYILSPTCCYPVFLSRTGKNIVNPTLISHKNICFRCEAYYESGTRQIAFLMREYIYLAPELEDVANWIEQTKREVGCYIRGLGLDVSVDAATDPFFNANDYKQKFQKDQNLKSEFVVEGVAVASINLHLRAFGKACEIQTDGGEAVYSACFGMGYDRIYEQVQRLHKTSGQTHELGVIENV